MYPDVLATSSGSGAISYQVVSDGGSGCTVNSSTAVINSTSAGACRVRATAAATGTESSGFAEATFYFRNTQTVTWSPTNLTNAIGNVTPNAVATTDGGGAITYSVYNAGTTGCTMVGSSIQATAVGVCFIRAVAAETDTRFFGAATASFTFTGTQTVTWYANNNLASLASSPLTPNALASSTANTAISYAVQDAGLTGCSVNASTAVVTAASNGLSLIHI